MVCCPPWLCGYAIRLEVLSSWSTSYPSPQYITLVNVLAISAVRVQDWCCSLLAMVVCSPSCAVFSLHLVCGFNLVSTRGYCAVLIAGSVSAVFSPLNVACVPS
jgi:hypothetical protein